MTETNWQGESFPILFLRPIGLNAADAMRMMEAAKRLHMPVRWRMAPAGVAADAYLAHRFSVLTHDEATTIAQSVPGVPSAESIPNLPVNLDASQSSGLPPARKIRLDQQGFHRGKPLCMVGRGVDTSQLTEDDLAPLAFPDALREMERGLSAVLQELVGSRMLYYVGAMALELRDKWATHRLHAVYNHQLIAVIEPAYWRFHLLEGCTVELIQQAALLPMPRSGQFGAQKFSEFMLESALWEFAKRCPEPMLSDILPSNYLQEPLTHRRTPHLQSYALGDHCVAILRALDVRPRTADELQKSLRMTHAALLRALTSLALVRAIQPESQTPRGWGQQLLAGFRRLRGQPDPNSVVRQMLSS